MGPLLGAARPNALQVCVVGAARGGWRFRITQAHNLLPTVDLYPVPLPTSTNMFLCDSSIQHQQGHFFNFPR